MNLKLFIPLLAAQVTLAGEDSSAPYSKSPNDLMPSMDSSKAAAKHAIIPPNNSGDWTLSISGGPAWRWFRRVSYDGSTRSGSSAIPSFVGMESLTIPPVGSADQIGDRTYNDGFVHLDSGTAAGGDTWNWGYDNSDQVTGGNLTYHATGAQSILRDERTVSRSRDYYDDLHNWAAQIQVVLRPPRSRDATFFRGWLLSGSFLTLDHGVRFSDFSERQFRDDYRLDYVDTYDLGGVVPPEAPYSGSFNGPGPLISNIPSSRSVTPFLIGTDSAAISNQVSAEVESNVFSVALGPTWGKSQGRWGWRVSAGVTASVYQWKTLQNERLLVATTQDTQVVQKWKDRDSGTSLNVGLFARISAVYNLQSNWFVLGFLEGELAPSLEMDAGPSSFRIDPSGFSAGIGIGKTF